MTMQMTQLTVHNLAFERNLKCLFHHIHFTLQRGESLQVVGTNGCGKSTLLRILAGLIEPQIGEILWENQSIFENRDHYQQQIQYLGHQNGVKPNLTVYENLQLSCALNSIQAHHEKLQIAIHQIGLKSLSQTPANQLSAGQLRRLSLAKLLLNPVPLWILDEPTTALDSEGLQLLTGMLNQHLSHGGMLVVATHQKLSLTENNKYLQLGEQNE